MDNVDERATNEGLSDAGQVRLLRELVASELQAGDEQTPEACPHCGHDHVVRRGRDGDGTQRWLCRGCHRTFTTKRRTTLSTSKLTREQWDTYVEGLGEGCTLRELAERCGVCLKTSWFMRQRLAALLEPQDPRRVA